MGIVSTQGPAKGAETEAEPKPDCERTAYMYLVVGKTVQNQCGCRYATHPARAHVHSISGEAVSRQGDSSAYVPGGAARGGFCSAPGWAFVRP